MVAAFDEMKGTDGGVRPGLWRVVALARGSSRRRARLPQARSRAVVPPHRHHLRGLWRSRRARTADPVRRHPAHHGRRRMAAPGKGPRPARQGAQSVPQGRLRRARDPARRRGARRPGVSQSGVPPRDERTARALRHLHPHRRHRHRARGRRDFLRARGQRAHALRRLLHAGEPRDHDAAVPGTVRAPPHRAGGKLSGRLARNPQVGRALARRARPDRGAAHARRLQLGLLRALVSRRQARRRTGRRPRPVRQGRDRLHAHHAGAAPRRRDLPAHRRRLHRPAHFPSRLGARRRRADVGLPGRQRHARQRRRHRHRRRQGGLQLHAGDREILSRRRAALEKRADLALSRGGTSGLCARPPEASWWSRKCTAPAATAC